MPEYTQKALDALDAQIVEAERLYAEALLSMGDDSSHESWHDNPAFDQAKQDVDMAKSKLVNLRALRLDAIVVERKTSHLVEVGTTVSVLVAGSEEPTVFHLAGHYVSRQAKDDSVYMLTTTSPLGAALMGHAEGDVVVYSTPTGRVMEATIIEFIE